MGDVDHFFGDDAGAGEFVLGDELSGRAGAQRSLGRAMGREPLGRDRAVVFRLDRAAGDRGVAARADPGFAHRREAGGEIDARVGFAIRAGRVIDAHRRLVRVGERNFAERHADVGAALGRRVDLARAANRSGGDALRRRRRFDLRAFVHGLTSALRPGSAVRGGAAKRFGVPRPFAGMTRIRFKGFGVRSRLSPAWGAPRVDGANLGRWEAAVNGRGRSTRARIAAARRVGKARNLAEDRRSVAGPHPPGAAGAAGRNGGGRSPVGSSGN